MTEPGLTDLKGGKEDIIKTIFTLEMMFASASAAGDNRTPSLSSVYMFFLWLFIDDNAGRQQVGTVLGGFRPANTPPQHNTLFPQMLSVSYVTLFETEFSDFWFFLQVEEKRKRDCTNHICLVQGRTSSYSSQLW